MIHFIRFYGIHALIRNENEHFRQDTKHKDGETENPGVTK
jgi:hypothetical protein